MDPWKTYACRYSVELIAHDVDVSIAPILKHIDSILCTIDTDACLHDIAANKRTMKILDPYAGVYNANLHRA